MRQQNYFHLLETEFIKLNEDRDAKLADKLEKELEKAAGELGGLKDTFDAADKEFKDWEKENEKLKKTLADL